jgi:bacillithiol system protein YtxJ
MDWNHLSSIDQLEALATKSFNTPQVLFKHSTRCSISSMALNRLESSTPPTGVDFYLLDLLQHRNISAAIAEKFKVHHESPQVLVIINGECTYAESHMGISMDEITAQTA